MFFNSQISFDALILSTAFGCFVVNLILHFIIFRFTKPGEVLKWLMILILFGGLLDIVSLGWIVLSQEGWNQSVGLLGLLIGCVVSVGIYGLLMFLYIICIFGPYESSIRLRLIRELHLTHPEGLSYEAILQRYNTKFMLERRLDRLTTSQDVRKSNDLYHINKKDNFFIIADLIAKRLNKFITGSH